MARGTPYAGEEPLVGRHARRAGVETARKAWRLVEKHYEKLEKTHR